MGADLQTSGQAVEQHTTYVEIIANEEPNEPGFAAVAGVVSCKSTGAFENVVLWFNDNMLFRHGRQGPDTDCLDHDEKTHVWATEEGAPDPRGSPSLAATGEVFEFTDPNGLHWVVEEYVYHQIHVFREESTRASVGDKQVGLDTEGEYRAIPHYAWVVKLQDAFIDPTINEYYNFVTIVDFAKLQGGEDGRAVHSGEPGDPRTGNSHNASDPDEEHRTPHSHGSVDVHLWVGGAPEEGPGKGYDEGARVQPRVILPDDVV